MTDLHGNIKISHLTGGYFLVLNITVGFGGGTNKAFSNGWRINDYGFIIQKEDKIGFWKCPYQNLRACIQMLERLKMIINQKQDIYELL